MSDQTNTVAEKDGPSPVDVHVGARIRLRRTLLGMSQEKLAEALGLTFQQVQKYERAANRVSASRLHDLSRVLDVPVGFFYDDMAGAFAGMSGTYGYGSGSYAAGGFAERQDGYGTDELLNQRESLELLRAYNRIKEPSVRKRMFELIKSMGQPEA